MSHDDAIITPQKGRNIPEIGDLAVMVSTQPDIGVLLKSPGFSVESKVPLFMSNVHIGNFAKKPCTIAGPIMGAPYAAMVMETLIAWGAKKFIFLGWCGSISPDIAAGNIVFVKNAHIDEGTSLHYGQEKGNTVRGSLSLYESCKLHSNNFTDQIISGDIWTMDAIFRETVEKVLLFRKRKCLAVEMETSALFSVANFRDVEICSILIVSDELSDLKWRPGFKKPEFRKGRYDACNIVTKLCLNL